MQLKDWFETKDYGVGLGLLGTHCKNRIMLQNLSRKPNPEKLEYELRKICEQQEIVIPTTGEIDETNGLSEDHTIVTEASKDETQPHSDQVIDQMNAEKFDKLKLGADEIVSDKLGELESEAEDIVSDNVNELKATARDIVEGKISEFESQVEEIMSGKLEVIRNGRKVNYKDLSPEMQSRWNGNRDAYKEIRATHEKLKLMENAAPEDRKPLIGRIDYLDDTIRENWAFIDAWKPGDEVKEEKVIEIDHKRINANRKFISTNLKTLLATATTDEAKAAIIKAKIQERYDELKNAGEQVQPDTIEELTKAGIQC